MIGRTNSTTMGGGVTPDGATVTPINDVSILLKCAGIKDRTYATMSELLAANDTDAMLDITMSDNAMQYLARSTGFADEVCANENFMAYLGQSPSVKDTVLNSDLWKQKIKASQYWTLVYASNTVTVYGAASETITIDGYYGSFTTGTDGSCSHVVPIDTITLNGSVSGQSFTRTVTSETTEVYVMPEGALYWYGGSAIETQYLSALSGGTRTKFDGSKSQTDRYWYRVAYMSTQKLNTSKYSNFHIIAKSSGTNASDTCAFVGTLGTISDLRYGSSVAISSSSLTEVEIPLNGYSVIDYVGFGMSQSSNSNRSIALTPNTNYVRYTDSLEASRIIDIYACWIE